MLFHHCNFQILVLMLLSLVGWNRPSTPAVDCVRDQAKIVRTIINKKILPILYRYSVSMPEDCPFYQGHDLFGWHERHKIRLYSTPSLGWKCGLCGATFKTESDIDLHFDNVHSGKNDLKNKSVCLADYCDIMRCNVFKPLLVLVGTNDSSSETLRGEDDFLLPANQSDQPEDWQHKCSEKMQQKLKTKCMAIIKDCLSGLLIGLSVKDFQDIEDDLNNAICSYLTCQRYWEYSLFEERHVPVLFYLVLGGILAAGAWVWYYFVWIYFSGRSMKGESSSWSTSKSSPSEHSLSAIRDRMNRQERCAPIFPPRLPYNEYRGLALRNRQYNLHRYREHNDAEYMLRYSRRVQRADARL